MEFDPVGTGVELKAQSGRMGGFVIVAGEPLADLIGANADDGVLGCIETDFSSEKGDTDHALTEFVVATGKGEFHDMAK